MRNALPALLALLLPGLLTLVPAPAQAAEFRLDGYYRFRGELFDTLSLDRDDESSELVRTYMEHRLRLV